MLKVLKLSSLFTLLCLLVLPLNAFADTDYTPAKSNGYKVYLSPANHSPDKTGCNSYSENKNAKAIATETAKKLQAMGYFVRVGSGGYVENVNNSNSWGAKLHVPIHSNATTFDCSGNDPKKGGTWVMYGEGKSSTAASKILATMKSASPGTNDKYLTDRQATGTTTLYETQAAKNAAAYVEAAFHTYGPDVTWLLKHATVAQTITNGIHSFSGANDCRTQTCMLISSVQLDDIVAPDVEYSTVEREEIKFDLNSHGKRFTQLEKELNELIKGNQEDTVFFEKTANMLNGVSIDQNGTVVVDFKDFTNEVASPSTYLIGKLNMELYDVIFKHAEVKEVYYQFDGSFSKWCEWLGIMEEPVTRQ